MPDLRPEIHEFRQEVASDRLVLTAVFTFDEQHPLPTYLTAVLDTMLLNQRRAFGENYGITTAKGPIQLQIRLVPTVVRFEQKA